MQGTPNGINIDDIQNKIKAIRGVSSIHDTHIWSIDGEHNILTTHVVLSKDVSLSKLCNFKKEIKEILKSFDITHDTIEFETKNECCSLKEC